jgi:hypothetical protein
MSQAIFTIREGLSAPVPEDALRKMSDCRRGDLAEALFIAGCIVYDWEIFKAFGHDHTADWVLVRGHLRLTVQVKTATIDRGDYCLPTKRGRGTTARPYSAGDFDILAAYLPNRKQFVFWSFADIRGRQKVRYNPTRHRKPNNWELLANVAESLTFITPKTVSVLPLAV